MTSIPRGPFFVPPDNPPGGGVDYLGLRQVNLDLMVHCLPGINNVTAFLRVFTLLSWSFWKLHALAKDAKLPSLKAATAKQWREKVELLFTWGHAQEDFEGLPGLGATPPGDGIDPVPLTFGAWGRKPENTSLMAAVQYGPPMKTVAGLGFIKPIEHGQFVAYGEGLRLAEALEAELGELASSDVFSLESLTGTADDARRLFPHWNVLSPTKAECDAFRRAFYDNAAIGRPSPIGRRSATLELARTATHEAATPLSLDQIRVAMTYGRVSAAPFTISPQLVTAQRAWTVLQLRQLQRLAFESLMGWTESALLAAAPALEDQLTTACVGAALASNGDEPMSSICSRLAGGLPDLDTWCARSVDEPEVCCIALRDELHGQEPDDSRAAHAVRALLLCAHVTSLLQAAGFDLSLLSAGRAERISLGHWSGVVARAHNLSLRSFAQLVIESHILGQHFAVVAGRFDDQVQRLRLTIEEDGLEVLVGEPWIPRVTRDRLHIALALMAQCGMLAQDEEAMYSWTESQ
jgi:hypothetical protein